MGSIPGSGRSPGGGHHNPLWYSCLGIPMNRGAWQATVYGVSENQTLRLSSVRLKPLSMLASKLLGQLIQNSTSIFIC